MVHKLGKELITLSHTLNKILDKLTDEDGDFIDSPELSMVDMEAIREVSYRLYVIGEIELDEYLESIFS